MSPPETDCELPTLPPALVDAVAKAIAGACGHRKYGGYDYSGYPGDAPPYVIRDEADHGRILFRTADRAAYEAEYKHLTEAWPALAALRATQEWLLAYEKGQR